MSSYEYEYVKLAKKYLQDTWIKSFLLFKNNALNQRQENIWNYTLERFDIVREARKAQFF